LDKYGLTGELRADVYKAGHHASKNGTNAAWMKAIKPKISIISAGNHDEAHSAPTGFHAWQFGHPTQQAVSLMEQFSSNTRPSIMVSTGNGAKSFRPEREVTRAVYCTCWDGDIVINAATLKVSTSP
jgi:beta-lactamase superfamily II metal-dependent hydrolase